MVSSNSPHNAEQVCNDQNSGGAIPQAQPGLRTVQTDLESLESLPKAIKTYAGILLIEAVLSFVPGLFDGPPVITAPGGHTSNAIVASVLHQAEAVEAISKQCTIEPWFFAPGANPHAPRNIMPREWFERV